MSTVAVYADIRARLLDHTPIAPLSGATLRASLGEKLYAVEAPDNAAYPYLVFRLQGRNTGSGDDARMQEQGEIELQAFGRPRSSQLTIEGYVDLAEQAMLHWHSNANHGPFTLRQLVTRDTMPPFPSPADREVVQVRAVWRYTWWPSYRAPVAQP